MTAKRVLFGLCLVGAIGSTVPGIITSLEAACPGKVVGCTPTGDLCQIGCTLPPCCDASPCVGPKT